MIIKSNEELEKLKAIGQIVAEVRDTLKEKQWQVSQRKSLIISLVKCLTSSARSQRLSLNMISWIYLYQCE